MTSDNYARHFKVLGKLAALFDLGTAQEADQETLEANLVDQVASGDPADNPAVELVAQFTSQLRNSITQGVVNLQEIAKNLASRYLTLPLFTASLVTGVPANNSPAAVLVALNDELVADAKTLTTKSATGIINLFDNITGTTGTYAHAVDGSADVKDSVYAVPGVV